MALYYYDSFSYQFYVETDSATVLNMIKNSKICVTRSHGDPSKICLNQAQDVSLTADDINTFAQTDSFDDVDIIAFIGCETAMGSNTITHAAYNAGATVTIGTTKSVSHQSANAWIDYFFTCMGIGFDVQTAIAEANTFMAKSYGKVDSAFCECVFVGDGSFVLP